MNIEELMKNVYNFIIWMNVNIFEPLNGSVRIDAFVGIVGVLVAIVIFLVLGAISWIITCGIFYLITLCFGLEFSWLTATGVWLVIILLKSIFNTTNKNKE